MLNERQLKIVDLLEQQPRTPGELAQQTGVSGRTILRDIDYLNFTLNGKARIFASGSAGYQLEIFERRSFFQLLQKHDHRAPFSTRLLSTQANKSQRGGH